MGAFHRCCAEQIGKSGSFVARYMGDGVLAYFGYPQAHEDDAERAVRAGLALVAAAAKLNPAAGPMLRVRVGIATGVVVVGELVGEGVALEHGVVGETPNLGASLQARAEPDKSIAQFLDDARLADARLAREQHYLAFAFLCSLPSLKQESDLGLAADKWRQVGAVQRLEAAEAKLDKLEEASSSSRISLGRCRHIGSDLAKVDRERLPWHYPISHPLR